MKYLAPIVFLFCFLSLNCGDTKPGNVNELPPIPDVGDTAEPPQDVPVDVAETVDDTGKEDTADAGPPPTDTKECPTEGACDTAGETRCSTGDTVAVERCEANADGCLIWALAEQCPKMNKCTGVADICTDGACTPPADAPDPNASCDTPDNSCVTLKCDPADGQCKELPVADQLPCDDGDVCTEGDFCFNMECQAGENKCPKQCKLDDLACGDSVVTKLEDDGLDTMDAYGCDGTAEGYEGAERVFKVQGGNQGCPDGATVTVEFDKPGDAGFEYVDLLLINPEKGICWPSDCAATSIMGDEGWTSMSFDLDPGQEYFVVVDGRNGFDGKVRVSVSCCGKSAEICSDGIDNTFEGKADCEDPACQDESNLCNYEYDCKDGIDNDDNGKTDCADAKCADSPACNIEIDCADGNDDDEDGKVDCDDSDCAGDAACAATCETTAKVLTCGDTLAGQALAESDTPQLASVPNCSDASEYGEGFWQKFYQIVPDCDGEYTVTVNPTGGGLFDAHLLDTSCSEDAPCAGTMAVWAAEESVTLKTSTYPSIWGLIVNAISGNQPGEFAVSVTCTCD